MTKEEYIEKMNADDDWAPGWDAIDGEFSRLYPGQEPSHYGTLMPKRAIFGGEEYLDGFSIYKNDSGYLHIVTFGMTELYCEPDSFGEEYSRWGYEMTMKLKEKEPSDCMWAINVLSNLARYTYKSKKFFVAGDHIGGNGSSIHEGTPSLITALLVVEDTTASGQDTVHGRVDFLQLVGITQSELEAIRKDSSNTERLIELMKKDSPELVTDMQRDFSYL